MKLSSNDNWEQDYLDWQKRGSPISSSEYRFVQSDQLDKFSDQEIIDGMLYAYQQNACNVEHFHLDHYHWFGDECRLFLPPNGNAEHYNIRWFDEWVERSGRTQLRGLTTRLQKIKVFW